MSTALVTGGASGLGEAICRRLAADGRRVVVADIDADAAERLAAEIDGVAVVGDVTRDADVVRMVEAAGDDLDALVLSAAIETRSGAVDCTDEDWQQVLDVNLKGPFLCMKHAIPVMVRRGGGSVVAMGSTLGLLGSPGYAAYCASKGALVNLCKQAAIEHAPDQVRVNMIAPSACDTGLFIRMVSLAPDPESIKKMVASRTPMGRLGRAADVCDAVAFLVGPGSTFLSGAVLPLDGGLAARRS